MVDMENVIKGLEETEIMLKQAVDRGGEMAVMGAFKCYNHVSDAIALLKEQEPIMIKTVMINGSGRNGRCQNCLMMLNEMDYPNFCGNCGQAVKWE